MKSILIVIAIFQLFLNSGFAQGRILLSVVRAPTQLESLDGPLAGRGIWGQFILGENLGELTPIADPVEHIANGGFHEFQAIVPDIPGGTLVYVQFLAWDGTAWGTDFELVPENQLGRTDAASYFLKNEFLPLTVPQFTQSAVVPPIPESSTWLLMAFGLAASFVLVHKRHPNRQGRGTKQ